MKSSKTIESMIELWEQYHEMRLIKTLCPEKWNDWTITDLEEEMQAHWQSMVLMIPIAHEWEIMKLAHKTLSRKEKVKLLLNYWKHRTTQGIINLHKRTFQLIKMK